MAALNGRERLGEQPLMHELTALEQRSEPQYSRVFRRLPWLGIGLLWLTACSSYQHQRLLEQGLVTQEVVASSVFQHAIFRPSSPDPNNRPGVHIYIEGDGLPWRTPTQIASNPTSPHASMLHAMLTDPATALLLGRPCYYADLEIADPQCNGSWWTSHRYSDDVVASMTILVERLAQQDKDLWLIGHSGGGTLAVLIGARLQRPVTVVTLAANLDVDAWTAHHHYSPLFGSLNPLNHVPRNPQMRELHWYGSHDTNVLPPWPLHYCAQWRVACLPYDGAHQDWLAQWPSLLSRSLALLPSAGQNSQRTPPE